MNRVRKLAYASMGLVIPAAAIAYGLLPASAATAGLIKGLGVTFKTMLQPNVTVQYPHVKEAPPTRARGVIALLEDNCTVCMLCARECPDWCIYIEGHNDKAPPRREGGKPRTVNILGNGDRYADTQAPKATVRQGNCQLMLALGCSNCEHQRDDSGDQKEYRTGNDKHRVFQRCRFL